MTFDFWAIAGWERLRLLRPTTNGFSSETRSPNLRPRIGELFRERFSVLKELDERFEGRVIGIEYSR